MATIDEETASAVREGIPEYGALLDDGDWCEIGRRLVHAIDPEVLDDHEEFEG